MAVEIGSYGYGNLPQDIETLGDAHRAARLRGAEGMDILRQSLAGQGLSLLAKEAILSSMYEWQYEKGYEDFLGNDPDKAGTPTRPRLEVVEPAPRTFTRAETGESLLTPRELTTIILVSEGYKSSYIARQLSRTKSRIQDYRESAVLKLGAKNSAHAVRRLFETGILPLPANAPLPQTYVFVESEHTELEKASLGSTLAERAEETGFTEGTIAKRRRSVVRKLHARNTIHAVRLGIEMGIIAVELT
jgi:DNA-binding NarL/FixJ family response regulator